MRRYLEWDYVADTVTEYKRDGKCERCGACCGATITFTAIHPYKRSLRGGGRVSGREGIWQEVNTGRWRYFVRVLKIEIDLPKTCGELSEDKLCTMHKDKCFLCKEWPFSPRCIAPFPECGYSFTEIQRGRISKLREEDEAPASSPDSP